MIKIIVTTNMLTMTLLICIMGCKKKNNNDGAISVTAPKESITSFETTKISDSVFKIKITGNNFDTKKVSEYKLFLVENNTYNQMLSNSSASIAKQYSNPNRIYPTLLTDKSIEYIFTLKNIIDCFNYSKSIYNVTEPKKLLFLITDSYNSRDIHIEKALFTPPIYIKSFPHKDTLYLGNNISTFFLVKEYNRSIKMPIAQNYTANKKYANIFIDGNMIELNNDYNFQGEFTNNCLEGYSTYRAFPNSKFIYSNSQFLKNLNLTEGWKKVSIVGTTLEPVIDFNKKDSIYVSFKNCSN